MCENGVFYQAEDGIRDAQESRGLGDVYKGQGWAGDCTGTGACTVAMDQARNVTATFEPTVTALSITPKSFPTSNADTPLSRLVRKRGAKISVSVSGDALVRFWIRRQPNRKGPKLSLIHI